MSKVKYIDNTREVKCNRCNGKGCNDCDNGIYHDKRFIMVVKTPEGQKIAFDVDQGK